MHLNGLKIFCFVAEMPQWLTQVSIIGQKIANLDTLFRFCGQAAEIEKAYDNNEKERKYFSTNLNSNALPTVTGLLSNNCTQKTLQAILFFSLSFATYSVD
jgi:hypothetical protein